jgi:hypothetical protein
MSKEVDHRTSSRLAETIERTMDWVRGFVFGAALSWTSVPYLLLRRHENERLFSLALYLNLRGLSPLPPRYRLWMLLQVTPQILYWRRRLTLWDESLETADLKHIGH